MPTQTLIAKISRPRLSKVLFRKRLFRSLDQGRRLPVTWVSGPGGSGKTTLIASYLDAKKLPGIWYRLDEGDGDIATFFYYLGLAAKKAAPRFRRTLPLLTSEYLLGIPTFTKRYFETLCARLKPPFVIVLDNYERVAPVPLFHDMVRDALSVIPEDITVIISSRVDPPPSLALLRTYNRLHYIGSDDLKFDKKETGALIASARIKMRRERVAGRLHRITEGWAAGLVLLLERLRTSGIAPEEMGSLKSVEMFDYFATELMGKTDPETQAFLLKTSFLPRISPQAAAELTGNSNAGQLFASLCRNHFFTERRSFVDPVYEYHPLFREFLQARARETYSRDEILNIMRHAARLLEGEGQLEDAAELCRLSEEWEGLVRLFIANVWIMNSQGRSRQIEDWLKSLPEKILDGDPWLLYWMGVCRMPFDLLEGQRYFERSLSLFGKQHDPAGVYLAWSGAVESVYQQMGDVKRLEAWLALFEQFVKEYGLPPPGIEAQVAIRIFAALPWRRDNPLFALWRNKALALMDSDGDPGLRMLTGFYLLMYHIWWIGDYATGRQVIEVMRQISASRQDLPPLIRIMHRSAEAIFALLMGDRKHCAAMVEEGLRISNNSGVGIWDNILLMTGAGDCLCARDLTGAGQFLDRMAPSLERSRLFDRFYFHHKSAWRFMLMNDIDRAVTHEEKALDLASRTGFEVAEAQARFVLAHLIRAGGKGGSAREHIERCRIIGERMGSGIVEFMSLLSEAALAFDEQKESAGRTYLKEALVLGKARGYLYFCGWIASLMTPLCVKALEAGIEQEYAAELVRKCRLVPEEPPVHIETWPWAVKIYTFGRFEIVVDGKPLRFTGKVQKKPLEMLRVLIALGGKNVGEHRFIDALWPEVDGDTSAITFKTTLHRLRKLLGGEDCVQLREGRLSLNRARCWIDAEAFERVIELAASQKRDTDRRPDVYLDLLEKGMHMYRGHFLDDSGSPWGASHRERLRGKYIRTVNTLGEHWLGLSAEEESPSLMHTSQSAIHKAIDCFQRGLEIDDVAEEFYQNLIICYLRLGNKAAAAKTYNRCRDALAAAFGVGPSEKTQELYGLISGKSPQ